MKPKLIIGTLAIFAISFVLGWTASMRVTRGEAAMAAFMTGYSSLAFLQKGDVTGAMALLRASTEGNLLEAERYGDWPLWQHDPKAMSKWFVQYGKLREKLSPNTQTPADPEFDQRVDEAVKRAAATMQR